MSLTECDHCNDAMRVWSQASDGDQEVHLRLADRRVVGDLRQVGLHHGRRGARPGLREQLLLDLLHRVEVLLDADLVVGAEAAGQAAEGALHVVERALALLEQDRLLRGAQGGAGEDARERGDRILHGRERLVGAAVDHARPDVRVLHHDAELERRKARAHPDVGRHALVDRDASSEPRRGAGAAHRGAGQELDAREHVPHALHVVVARPVRRRLHVDAVEDEELLLVRRQRREDRRQREAGLGARRQPAVEDRAVRREDDDEPLRRRGRGPHAPRQEGGAREHPGSAEELASADAHASALAHGVTSLR